MAARWLRGQTRERSTETGRPTIGAVVSQRRRWIPVSVLQVARQFRSPPLRQRPDMRANRQAGRVDSSHPK